MVLQSGLEPEHLTAATLKNRHVYQFQHWSKCPGSEPGPVKRKSTQIIERGGRVAEPAVPAERVVVLLRWELAAAVGMGQERVAADTAAEEGTELQAEEHTEDSAGTEADNPASAADSPLGLTVAYLGVLPSMQ